MSETSTNTEVDLLAQWQEFLGWVDDDNQHAMRAQFIGHLSARLAFTSEGRKAWAAALKDVQS